jgi:hypothetical protein
LKTPLVTALILVLAGCAMPQTTVRTGSTQPSLIVHGASPQSVLYVDGLSMGAAQQFNGDPKVLAVLEGVHELEVREGSTVIYHSKALLGSGETYPITLAPPGTAK